MQNNITHGTDCKYRTAVMLYIYIYPRNMICFRYIIVNTQHEGDRYKNDDDDDDNNKRTAKTGEENEETANHTWTASPKGRRRSLLCSKKNGERGLIQLEAAHAVEITKLLEYIDRQEDPLIQVVRTHQLASTQQ
jgi:hypothetical protein